MPPDQPQPTKAILEQLRREERLKQHPQAVHVAFRKRAIVQLRPREDVLTPAEQALIDRYPDYQCYATQEMQKWQAATLNGIVAGPKLVDLLIAVNQLGERAGFGPFFLDQPQPSSEAELEIERYLADRSQKLISKKWAGKIGVEHRERCTPPGGCMGGIVSYGTHAQPPKNEMNPSHKHRCSSMRAHAKWTRARKCSR